MALGYVWGSVGQIGIYIIGLPMCLSILHCGGFPSSAQYSSIDVILSFAYVKILHKSALNKLKNHLSG